jgi:hypothetical protein
VKSHSGGAFVLAAVLAVSALAVALAGPALAVGGPPGNNGTIKIHEKGTPERTESNDPKVCVFNVEGYGFDVGQRGYLMFEVQGGDSPRGTNSGPHDFGPTEASAEHRSYYQTGYFNDEDGPRVANGHYKATLYGKFGDTVNFKDVKAKSKVFKVSCEQGGQQPSSPPTQPSSPPSQPSSPPGQPSSPPGRPSSPPGQPSSPPGQPSSPPGQPSSPPAAGATPTPTPAGAVGGETGTPVPTLPPTNTFESAQSGGNVPIVLLVLLAIGSIVAGATVLRPRPIRTRR